MRKAPLKDSRAHVHDAPHHPVSFTIEKPRRFIERSMLKHLNVSFTTILGLEADTA